jgi:hypothetical protein
MSAIVDLTDEAKWPSVEAAYDFALPSYTWLLSRFEAADTRLMNVLTIALTVTLGMPVFAKNVRPDISFRSPLFWFAITCFVVCSVVALVGRIRGSLRLPNPGTVYKKSLHLSDWQFRKDHLFYAGQDFIDNATAIDRKWHLATIASVAILVEGFTLVCWLAW